MTNFVFLDRIQDPAAFASRNLATVNSELAKQNNTICFVAKALAVHAQKQGQDARWAAFGYLPECSGNFIADIERGSEGEIRELATTFRTNSSDFNIAHNMKGAN